MAIIFPVTMHSFPAPNVYNCAGVCIALGIFCFVYGMPGLIYWDGMTTEGLPIGGEFFGWPTLSNMADEKHVPWYLIVFAVALAGYLAGSFVKFVVSKI